MAKKITRLNKLIEKLQIQIPVIIVSLTTMGIISLCSPEPQTILT